MLLSIITPTHNTIHLKETWESLQSQTYQNFEWVVGCNGNADPDLVAEIVDYDPRVKISRLPLESNWIGAIKKQAFSRGNGEVLVELDHDDLLTPTALAEIESAFADKSVGFVYSDSADFQHGASSLQGDVTYLNTERRKAWEKDGWDFYEQSVEGIRPGKYLAPKMFPLTALSVSTVYHAPNHVRAWRRSVYEMLGGHNMLMPVCDDHELVVRTYLKTKIVHIPHVLYLYRVAGDNTWLQNIKKIQELTFQTQIKYLERLVLRECELAGSPIYDLGSGIAPRVGWTSVDLKNASVITDLAKVPWPFDDNSVGAFRAVDLLEHLPDKMQTMREIHRCLRPGGWFLSHTPSTDGRGAWQDPTHVSFWNQNSHWYWTRKEHAQYIDNTDVRFKVVHLDTIMPTKWHEENNIPYVRANLIALKEGYQGPGETFI